MEDSMSPSLRVEARRLAEAPGVLLLSGASDVYLLSCLSVLHEAPNNYVIGAYPLSNEDLMSQIQLVADGILSWKEHRHLLA
jgi:hypothetical protein